MKQITPIVFIMNNNFFLDVKNFQYATKKSLVKFF